MDYTRDFHARRAIEEHLREQLRLVLDAAREHLDHPAALRWCPHPTCQSSIPWAAHRITTPKTSGILCRV
ncbi:hypothetical protein SAMN04487818_1224 [Actinokineospora terrae]|uniref:Uncharacterized protein n=1 Tax=Actinokineospora terrae TaxID=155974 RepID=A0A1H9XRI2_9PSEU|nr:hypothetical protein SAMN04487818_1224 [Actinokineospora terrae]